MTTPPPPLPQPPSPSPSPTDPVPPPMPAPYPTPDPTHPVAPPPPPAPPAPAPPPARPRPPPQAGPLPAPGPARPGRAAPGAAARAALADGSPEPVVSDKPFADRQAAGRALAARMPRPAGEVVVLGLPRGGVVVAAEVAAALEAPLDVLVVRKIGLPWQPELAMGAIAGAGDTVETVRTESVIERAAVPEEVFEEVQVRELAELRRREAAYRRGRPAVSLAGRAVVLVDDGLATGSTMRAAVAAVRRQEPDRVIVAVPIGSPSAVQALTSQVDEVICLSAPRSFRAVGQGYVDFAATTDDQVREALEKAAGSPS